MLLILILSFLKMNVQLIGMIMIITTTCHYKPLLIVKCVSSIFFTSWPESINDARLLRNYIFYKLCDGGERLNGTSVSIGLTNIREYIIGDGGYPLLPWLITPSNGVAKNDQRSFNYKLSSTYIVVECVFGRLKGIWWILNSKICHPNLQLLPKYILVCCIIHNIMLTVEEDIDNDYLDEYESTIANNETIPRDSVAG